MLAEIQHHLGELWIRNIDLVRIENNKIKTFEFRNQISYKEAKELFEDEITDYGERTLRAVFDDYNQKIKVIEGTEWNINIDLFN